MDGGCWFENVSFLLFFQLNSDLETRLMLVLICSWVDKMGNVHGRVEGMNASAEALLIGSHLVMLLFFPFRILV